MLLLQKVICENGNTKGRRCGKDRVAAAFSLVFNRPPVLFTGDRFPCCAKDGVKNGAVSAFFGFDDTTGEIFKALASTDVSVRASDGKVVGIAKEYFFFVNEDEKSMAEKLPYVRAAAAVRRAERKDGYYPLPDPLAKITICSDDDDSAADKLCSLGAFVWAVVADGNGERAKTIADRLKKNGAGHCVFYESEEEADGDGLKSFRADERLFLKLEGIAASRAGVYSKGVASVGRTGSKTDRIKRESNLYAALSLRQLLLCCGFDCAESGEDAGAEFYRLYRDGLRGAQENCRMREILARREHLRWNEYMFACGISPASKRTYLAKGERFVAGRYHVNLTTWDGLEEFAKDEAARTGLGKSDTDVQKYDFEIADEAGAMLAANGMKIIRR